MIREYFPKARSKKGEANRGASLKVMSPSATGCIYCGKPPDFNQNKKEQLKIMPIYLKRIQDNFS